MKYSIETTESGAIEKLEIGGKEYIKKHTRHPGSMTCESKEFCEQLENAGLDEDVSEKIFEVFDGACSMLAFDIVETKEYLSEYGIFD